MFLLVALSLLAAGLVYIPTGFSQIRTGGNIKVQTQARAETHVVTDPTWAEPVSPETLADESELIVMGKALENKCLRTQDGSILRTLYKFKIDQVVKGGHNVDDVIYVSSPGGLIGSDLGTALIVITPGYMKMRNDQRYLVFLERRTGQEFKPTRGPQGIFEVNGDRLKPHSTYLDKNPKNDEETIALDDFLRRFD